MPARAYDGDAGLDLAACERVELAPGERAPSARARGRDPRRVRGLRAAAVRSGGEHGITIVNTPGLVDSGYRGELKVILLNTDEREAFVVEPGMRIAQLVVVPVRERRAGRGGGAARERARRARLRVVAA